MIFRLKVWYRFESSDPGFDILTLISYMISVFDKSAITLKSDKADVSFNIRLGCSGRRPVCMWCFCFNSQLVFRLRIYYLIFQVSFVSSEPSKWRQPQLLIIGFPVSVGCFSKTFFTILKFHQPADVSICKPAKIKPAFRFNLLCEILSIFHSICGKGLPVLGTAVPCLYHIERIPRSVHLMCSLDTPSIWFPFFLCC
jgi:hypothetical protein